MHIDRSIESIPRRKKKRAVNEHVLWEQGEQRITIVNSASPKHQKKRAGHICIVSNLNMDFDFPVYDGYGNMVEDMHILLFYNQDYIDGWVSLQFRPWHFRSSWKTGEMISQAEKIQPRWTVTRIWVRNDFRRQGIASRLLYEACVFLNVEQEKLAWMVPFSESGSAFAKEISPRFYYVTV